MVGSWLAGSVMVQVWPDDVIAVCRCAACCLALLWGSTRRVSRLAAQVCWGGVGS